MHQIFIIFFFLRHAPILTGIENGQVLFCTDISLRISEFYSLEYWIGEKVILEVTFSPMQYWKNCRKILQIVSDKPKIIEKI